MQEILKGIQALFPNDSVIELRVPGKPTIVGWFRDRQKLAAAIADMSGKYTSVYYTLNPPAPLLYDDSLFKDKALANVNATRDDQIVSRDWLLIDCDPIRVDPAGLPLKDQKVSSTEDEKATALATLYTVYKYLESLGWPAPTSADSGNGYHLLYSLGGMKSTEELTAIVKAVLQNLATKFNTDRVKIDTTVYNPSRITKAYGSLACKGLNTPDRPHRKSQLRKIAAIVPVTIEQLKLLAAITEPAPAKKPGLVIKPKALEGYATAETHADKLEEFLDFYDIDYKARYKEKDGYSWQIIPCPFNETHNIGEVGVSCDEAGKKGFKCFHESCKDNHWQEFVQHLQITTGKRFFFTTNSTEAVPAFAETKTKLAYKKATDIKPEVLDWLWPNRVPFGKLTLFVGHPAVGKGMATMYLAGCATTGGGWADCPNVNTPMEIAVISSEDASGDTVVPRLIAAGADLDKVHIVDCAKTPDGEKEFSLDTDLPALRVMLEENPGIRLVTIDPIMNHLGKVKGNSEQELRSALTPLGKLAEHFHVAIVIVTHFNKTLGTEAIQRVGGAMGMVGAVRLAWTFAEDKDTGTRSMIPLKANVVKDIGGLEYTIENKDLEIEGKTAPTGYLKFGDKSHITADSVMKGKSEKSSKISEAVIWLETYLSDGEPRPAKDVINAGAVAGQFDSKTLGNALKKLDGVSTPIKGMSAGNMWQLPKKDA